MIPLLSRRLTANRISLGAAALIFVTSLFAQTPAQLSQQPSPGTAIEAAAKATSQDRRRGTVDILSDTQGVDFGPYLSQVVATVRENWYKLIPTNAELKKGKVAIEFRIQNSGEVREMKLVASAGPELDHPALGSITASLPFHALPEAFHGEFLALRFRYFYNPDRSDLENPAMSDPGAPASRIQHAVLIQSTADSHPIKYPKKAIGEKTDGIVRLMADIAPDGGVESVASFEGSLLLGDAASKAIRRWRFQPGHSTTANQSRNRYESG